MLSKTIYVIVCNGVPVVAFENESRANDELYEKKADNEFIWGLEFCDLILEE